jgi:hypothetical protein
MSNKTSDLESITTPEKVETRLGTFSFPLGFPTDDSVSQAYDQLDFHHALDARHRRAFPASG